MTISAIYIWINGYKVASVVVVYLSRDVGLRVPAPALLPLVNM